MSTLTGLLRYFHLVVPLGLTLAITLLSSKAAPLRPVLPLKASASGQFLVDQNDQPFLVAGDTGWSLIAQLDEKGVERYLSDRQERGFNSTIVNLLEHKFSSDPPNTRAGLKPFLTPGDFATPNREYFDWAHQVVERAHHHGLVVWLAPAYLGFGGGDEGFFKEIRAGGEAKLQAYGRFVAERFKDLPNIVWMIGGDFSPAPGDRWTITSLASAIWEKDPQHPITVHLAPEHPVESILGDPKWLTIRTVYSYKLDLVQPLLSATRVSPRRPFVLIESTYEGEHKATPDEIRRQAYWAMLGGACGQFFGNNPIWHFDGPGIFQTDVTWNAALDAVGSRDMARWTAFFNALPWTKLQPEQSHSVIADGYGSGPATALTALTADGKLSLTYVPASDSVDRELTVQTARFPGPVRARWFDPQTGKFLAAQGAAGLTEQTKRFRTPRSEENKPSDWVLVLSTE